IRPELWIAIFDGDPAVHRAGASYLTVAGFAFPLLGLAMTMNFAFQAAGRPLWPLVGSTSRLIVVAIGGWIGATNSLVGLGLLTVGGFVAFGTSMAGAFYARVWRPQPKPVASA